jgi:hypothetical protein
MQNFNPTRYFNKSKIHKTTSINERKTEYEKIKTDSIILMTEN